MNETKELPPWLTIGQAAAHIGVSVQTLRNWDKTGKLKAERDGYGRRTYSRRQVLKATATK